MKLCECHRAESDAWIDWIGTDSCRAYLLGGVQLITIGSRNVRLVAEARGARARSAYDLVRRQQALIRESCERDCAPQ